MYSFAIADLGGGKVDDTTASKKARLENKTALSGTYLHVSRASKCIDFHSREGRHHISEEEVSRIVFHVDNSEFD